MDRKTPHFPATPKKNIALAAILIAGFYLSMIGFQAGNIIAGILSTVLMSVAMYAVMTYGKSELR